jgi:hypothetical protein
MLKVIGAAPGSHTEIDWHKTWNESEEKKAVKAELADMKANGGNASADHSQPDDDREFAASTKTQFVEATKRIAQAYWRTPTYFYSKFILVVGTVSLTVTSYLKLTGVRPCSSDSPSSSRARSRSVRFRTRSSVSSSSSPVSGIRHTFPSKC